ncbi:uncharacterized protein Pyn_13966 [Prunus yedoensis var. nudiflora]|uniref:Uncharacterized protein n=1 Tax=Prunus yedoensis var. nudiflora TaxID=2094558 RepID=A0A314YS54_PRUYE|nr:uncharacterized protein Pyn_13966 [Prunus yedoensis var. nudiflora]
MVSNFNDIAMANKLPMGLTENNSATYLSTGNPCLDFFFHVVPNTPADYVNNQLPLAWTHSSPTTLKLICNLRGVRAPESLTRNTSTRRRSFADFGYFKDLPEILYRLLEGEDVRRKQRDAWKKRSAKKQSLGCDSSPEAVPFKKIKTGGEKKAAKNDMSKEENEAKAKEWVKSEKERASVLRKEKKIAMAKKAVARYGSDPDFRFLHERVSDLFAELLKADMENLKSNQSNKISLAPSGALRSTLRVPARIVQGIRRHGGNPLRLQSERSTEEGGSGAAEEGAGVARGLYGREAVGFASVQQSGVSGHEELQRFFLKHDEERFKKYLEDVKAGKAKIAAGALLPHEIIKSLEEGDVGEVAELQWKRMVEDMLKLGKMKNCLAVCDVSGSMCGTPMEVAISLGLLVSELSEDPWKGLVITFSADPELHLVKGDDLKTKCQFVRDMDWGMNTDFQKVFDLLLRVAVKGNLKPENMIKRVLVFSDMEFDEASPNSWETDYDVIQEKFRDHGYGNVIPQLVFWNLRHSRSTPVPGNQPGVALLSGFSKNLLKLFMDNDGEIRPDEFMELAISGEEYQKLVVHD